MNAPIRIKDPNSSKQYSFNLTFGGMAVLLSALTLALTLFFILGVLVGRGHRPETAVPVVAGMMPKDPMSRAVPSPEVLKAEDLNYGEQLGKRNDAPAPARAMDKNEHKAPEKKAEKAEAKKDPKKDAKAEAKPEAKPEPKAEAKTDAKKAEKLADKKAAEKKPDPDTQRYDYAYQAATFPDADSAKAFLKRVKSMGLKGDIETGTTNGKNWHRVVVFFQGTPTDTRALKEKLGTLGAQKLVMRSKTPI
ncbi:SPOR domain-containing protein [Humidesulfovibrio idahonensis]